MDWTIPVSVATFFVGLILTVSFALPRWKDVNELYRRVKVLYDIADKTSIGISHLQTWQPTIDQRLDVAEKNIATVNGNLLTVRDQVQFKGIAASMRGAAVK